MAMESLMRMINARMYQVLQHWKGCPDKDGDGIADAEDECPDVAGLAKYKSCRSLILMAMESMMKLTSALHLKGVARYQGCPIPDSDNDGLNDEDDKCPNRPGPASNQVVLK